MADVFRKSALERLSSPEQLDKAITVSSPVSWLPLLGVTIVVTAVVLWSILGTLPAAISAQGITAQGTPETDMITCYISYAEATGIQKGLKAIVSNESADSRLDAVVTDVVFDNTEFSDLDLIFNSGAVPVVISLQLTEETLPERTLVDVKIITDEVAPLNMLFKGLVERKKG